jgi:phosphoglycolate phosphatase
MGSGAVVFDLDGTLVDSAPDLAAALGVVLSAAGRAPLPVEAVRGLIGEGARQLLDRAFRATGAPAVRDPFSEFQAAYAACLCERTVVYPGIGALLDRLVASGRPIAVCTNKPEKLAVAVVRGLNLPFDVVVGGDRLAARKPDPGMVRLALAELGVSDAWFVGDSAIDVAAARSAGLPVVGVTWGYGDVSGADVVARDAAGLARALDADEGTIPPT